MVQMLLSRTTNHREITSQAPIACLSIKQCVCADVYERLTPKGKPPTFFTLIVTQLVSGVWHGLFPGYVLFFISSALMFQSSKVLYRYERNWPKSGQTFPLWTLAKWAYTAFTLNYCASAFLVSLCKLASFWPISSRLILPFCCFGQTQLKFAVHNQSCCCH